MDDDEAAAILVVVDGATNAVTLPREEMPDDIAQQRARVLELLKTFIFNPGVVPNDRLFEIGGPTRCCSMYVLLINDSLT